MNASVCLWWASGKSLSFADQQSVLLKPLRLYFTSNFSRRHNWRNYDASVVIRQLRTRGYEAGVIIATLKDFHKSKYDATIVNTFSYFYN